MKKIFLILVIAIAMSINLSAQSPFSQTATNPTGTITNTGLDTMNYTLGKSYRIVSVQPVVLKTSGTVAGTATLYYSVDGTRWVASGSTLSLTDVATNTTVWNLTTAARYLRIITGGGTTMVVTTSARVSATQ